MPGTRTRTSEQPLLSKSEVAELLAVSEKTIQRLNSRGAFPEPVRVGGSLRWRRADLAKYLGTGGRTTEYALSGDPDALDVFRAIHARRGEIRHRAFPLPDLRTRATNVNPDSSGTFSGVAATYSGDAYPVGGGVFEKIAPGAFAESVRTKASVPVFLEFNIFDPIGAATLRDTDRALEFDAEMFASERAASVMRCVDAGALEAVALGFIAHEVSLDTETGVETITRGEILEMNVVVKGIDPGARIVKVGA